MSSKPQKPPRRSSGRFAVALLVETSNRYSRELLHGVRAWMRDRGGWAVHLTELGRGDLPPPWLRHWQGDGILARIETSEMERSVRAVGVPVVNVSAAARAPEFSAVISDSAAIARVAAEHLLERGFQHFGYCGDARFAWSARHGENFQEALQRAGHTCHSFVAEPSDFDNWDQEQRKLAKWVQSLPKPVGVMACYDIRGQQVLDVCRAIGVAVPDEVAVIGQHNDELLCDLCDPPLSSVIPNARRAGYEAAALLDRLMRGEAVPASVITIEPLGVATRQSTDVVAVEDAQMSAAVRYIREHAREGIGVDDVLRAVPMSRSLLERRFKQTLGRTPHEHILAVRLNLVKSLLTNTDLSLAAIAERTGFEHVEYLSVVFKRVTGLPPSQWRSKHRA